MKYTHDDWLRCICTLGYGSKTCDKCLQYEAELKRKKLTRTESTQRHTNPKEEK